MQISRHGFKAFFRLAPTRQPRQGYLRGASAQLILAKAKKVTHGKSGWFDQSSTSTYPPPSATESTARRIIRDSRSEL